MRTHIRTNITKAMVNFGHRYCLELGNGGGWHIIATEGIGGWVEKLASIMELKPCEPNGNPKLIFTKRESKEKRCCNLIRGLNENTLGSLPRKTWRAHNLGVLQLWSHDDVTDVICEIGPKENHDLDIIRIMLSVYPIYQRVLDSGGLPFHAALLERDGKGIVLAGSGGVGKSTCCRRTRHPWYALCDDETLIVRDDKMRYFAHPFPTWSEYIQRRSERTWNVQREVPLSSIFFLGRAEKTEVIPIGQGKAAILINQSATEVCKRNWIHLDRGEERGLRKKLFDNACEIAKTVPSYILRVSLTGRFWEKIEEALR